MISLGSARTYIDQLDLSYIINFMSGKHYPLPRWQVSDAVECCRRYKNFLFLLKKYLPEFLVPTREIDEFWHNHILYTKNYFRDSLNIFGCYLHHDPAFPDENTEFLIQQFIKTKQYYFKEFNQILDIIHH